MKKSLIVLLIVVLAIGSAFAEISGSFTGKYVIDFDNKSAEYKKYNPDFGFTLVSETNKTANEGSVYAVLDAAAKFGTYNSAEEYLDGYTFVWTLNKKNSDNDKVWTDGDQDIESQISLSVKEISINGENWKLDLGNILNKANYAADVIDTLSTYSVEDEAKVSKAFGYSQSLATYTYSIPGTTFTYNGFKFATAFNAGFETVKTAGTALVAAETADLAFGDVTGKAYAGFSINNGTKKTAGSVKVAYADIANVAADFGYTADKFDADVALNVKYAPVTVDAYFATTATATTVNCYDEDLEKATIKNLLSAKVAADLNTYEIPVKVTVTGKNLLNSDEKIDAKAKIYGYTATKANSYVRNLDVVADTTYVADTTLSVYGKNLLSTKKLGAKAVYTGIEATTLTGEASYTIGSKALAVDASVKYVADLYTANFGVDFDANFAKDTVGLGFSAGVTSTTLVSGATLSVAYSTGADSATGDAYSILAPHYGKLTTKCVVAF